jgi:alpha-ribazole phosphatase
MIVLCRHGRTEANAAGLLQGRLDPPLDATGEQQVRAAAAMVGTPDVLICSPLLRARQTAAGFGVEAQVDERWIELDYGDWEGRPLRDVPDATWEQWRADPQFSAPRGESLAELDVRVRDACESIVDIARNALVVVVSHVSPIKSAVAWALGVDVTVSWRCQLDQASVCTIAITPRGPSLASFNVVAWR